MERLSLLDAEFLHLEDGIAHMHIGGLSVFEGPAPAAGEVERLMVAKLHRIPRYRQRVRSVPFELGRPIWVDDPHFDLAYHVRHTALAAPHDDDALRRLMARLMSQPLDRDRPLWEVWTVEGLPEGRWAIIWKVHHCLVDGIAGVDLLTVLLDVTRDVALADPEPWEPAPEPSAPAKVVDAWAGLATDAARTVGRFPGAARDPLASLRRAGDTALGLVRFAARLVTPTPQTSIDGGIGAHRVWAHAEVPFDDVRTVRRAFGGTVNDVVLAALAGAYRALLAAHGDDVSDAVVRTLVPVSVRGPDGNGIPDNRVSAVLLDLPVDLVDPIQRLDTVRERMAELKASHMADAGEMVTGLGNLAPPMLVGTGTRAVARLLHRMPARSVDTVTTNVPGPQFPLYCLGREMLAYHPFVPITHGVRVGTAILSYNGQLAFGITGDYDSAPDVAVLADAVAAGIAELRDLAEPVVACSRAG